jgi:hypothetical protein
VCAEVFQNAISVAKDAMLIATATAIQPRFDASKNPKIRPGNAPTKYLR